MNFCQSLRAFSTMECIFSSIISSPVSPETTVHLLKSPKELVERMIDDTSGLNIVFRLTSVTSDLCQNLRKFHGRRNPSNGFWDESLLGSTFSSSARSVSDTSDTCQLLKVMLATHVSPVRQEKVEKFSA